MQVVPSASGTGYELAPLPDHLYVTLSNTVAARLADRYGPPIPPRDHCETCDKKGVFRTRLRNGEVVECKCNCVEQWLLMRRFQAANLDRSHWRFSHNHVQTVPDDVWDRVTRYTADLPGKLRSGLGMVLWSDRRGTGKSMLTALILKEAIAQGLSAYYIRFVAMKDLNAAGWRDPAERDYFARMVENIDMLGLDDLGKEQVTEKSSAMVDELFDRVLRSRVANLRPVVLNSNLDPDSEIVGQGFERYQHDVVELLSEGASVVHVGGTTYRPQARELRERDDAEGIVYPIVVR
jgi:DNA replication protein DnaC